MANVSSYIVCICSPVATRSIMDIYVECLIIYCVHLDSNSDTKDHYDLWRMSYHILHSSAFQNLHAAPWILMANVLSYIVIICTPAATHSVINTYGECLIIYCTHLHSNSDTQHHGYLRRGLIIYYMHLHSSSDTQHNGYLWRMSCHILYASALQ